MFYEPHIDHVELACERLAPAFDGLSVLHLSDLHVTRWTRRLSSWHAALAHLQPDLVVITGDLGHRSWHWKQSLSSLVRLLQGVQPPLGTFFILGNHDSVKLGPALAEALPATYLRNEAVLLAPPGGPGMPPEQRFALIGIHQHRRIDTDIPTAIRQVRPADFKLMLLHYPDLVHEAAAAGADVCLAGHTHGGQICWPDGQPFFRQDVLSNEMCTGVHQINGTWMVVSRGIGAAGVRLRMFCPPQAIMVRLRAGRKGRGKGERGQMVMGEWSLS